MSIDSLFILGQQGDLVAIRSYKGLSRKDFLPEFYASFVRKFNGSKQEREYPLMKVKDLFFGFVTSADILVGAVVNEEIPVLQIYATLYHVVDVLKGAYKTKLSFEVLRTNFASIELMLDSFLDYGYPLITQKFVLESMVREAGYMEKIEKAIVGTTYAQKDNMVVLEKFIDSVSDVKEHAQYRIPDIRGEEEVFFDVIEFLDCVIDKSGKYIVEEINGEVKMECNLSGVPDIYVFLSQPIQFNDFSVHECLINRVDTYEREKVLNFIPPTGSTTLFYYNLKSAQVRVPFDVIPRLTFTDKQARIEIKIANRPVRGQSYIIEEFHVKLITPIDLVLGETEMQQGQLQQADNCVIWRIGKLEIDHSTKLMVQFSGNKGSQNLKNGNFILCLKFVINQYSASQTKIDKVEVRNHSKPLTKKARNISKSGYYEMRLN